MARLTSSLWLLCAACGGGGGFPDAPGIDTPPTGTFSLTWSVVDTASQPLSCDRIAGTSMTVLAHNKEFIGGSTQPFGCSTGAGTSQALIAGVYDLAFELGGTVGLLDTAPPQDNVVITANEDTMLAPITFEVDATGALSLMLASGKTGGNCGTVVSGGAGIEFMSITMTRNSDGACAPLTLAISQGATQPAATYTINCTSPVDGPCIEADQVISATGVDSDAYTLRVKGKIATKACWANNDSIQVPPLGKTLMRTLNLAQTQIPGC